jgi:hypothetical protein
MGVDMSPCWSRDRDQLHQRLGIPNRGFIRVYFRPNCAYFASRQLYIPTMNIPSEIVHTLLQGRSYISSHEYSSMAAGLHPQALQLPCHCIHRGHHDVSQGGTIIRSPEEQGHCGDIDDVLQGSAASAPHRQHQDGGPAHRRWRSG